MDVLYVQLDVREVQYVGRKRRYFEEALFEDENGPTDTNQHDRLGGEESKYHASDGRRRQRLRHADPAFRLLA